MLLFCLCGVVWSKLFIWSLVCPAWSIEIVGETLLAKEAGRVLLTYSHSHFYFSAHVEEGCATEGQEVEHSVFAVALLKVASHPTPSPSSQTHRPGQVKNRVTWTLKFTLPAPTAESATRRFSAVPRVWSKRCTRPRRDGTLRLSLQLSTRSHNTSP